MGEIGVEGQSPLTTSRARKADPLQRKRQRQENKGRSSSSTKKGHLPELGLSLTSPNSASPTPTFTEGKVPWFEEGQTSRLPHNPSSPAGAPPPPSQLDQSHFWGCCSCLLCLSFPSLSVRTAPLSAGSLSTGLRGRVQGCHMSGQPKRKQKGGAFMLST